MNPARSHPSAGLCDLRTMADIIGFLKVIQAVYATSNRGSGNPAMRWMITPNSLQTRQNNPKAT